VQIADAVAAGQVSASAVLAEHLARYRDTAAQLNALVQPRHAMAVGEASAADQGHAALDQQSIGRAQSLRLLAGVPISVKECFAVRGLLTTLGIARRRIACDQEEARLIGRLRAAGAIVVGKANVPQAMFLHETVNPVWGRTLHPLAGDRGPGGSSGGDAALVAAGVVPLAVGTDLAGSIRQPAHACGIAGIVPRSQTLGDGGAFNTMPHLEVVQPRAGFLARHVDDLGQALAAVGIDTQMFHKAGRIGIDGKPLRIAFWDQTGPLESSPAVRRAVAEGVACLRAAGATVTRVSETLATRAAWTHLALLSADGGAAILKLFAGTQPIPPVARLLRLAGLPQSVRPSMAAMAGFLGRRIEAESLRATGPRQGDALEHVLQSRLEIAAQIEALAQEYDAIVCPVSALPALRHGTAATLIVAAAPCLLANLLDLPAGTVRVTRVRPEEENGRAFSWDPVSSAARATDRGSRGLPVGVQVIGLDPEPGRGEGIVLSVMRTIERSREE